jgi:hypothetical protein
VRNPSRPLSTRGPSVQADWRKWLPQEKAQVFLDLVQHLENVYSMFSVSLNEAIELRREGRLFKSLKAIGISSELCNLFTAPLAGLLRALSQHARHYGTTPNAAPLDPANFLGLRVQRSARVSGLLNRVLLSHRLQFLHKVSTIEEMVEDLGEDYRQAADELAAGLYIDPGPLWNRADAGHYDLNTCLRETIVLLKSFLIALPEGQLEAFQNAAREHPLAPAAEAPALQPVIRGGRTAAIAGE